MNTNALVAVLNRLEEIRVGTTDIGELSGVTNAIVRIKSAGAIDLESTLKQIRDELFYYKGPLYDSFDASENMKALRQELYLAFKRAINILIENRRPDLKLAIGDR